MNLFKIPPNYLSHPNYALLKHTGNIAAVFEEQSNQFAALFHDLGKLKLKFQEYIREPTKGKRTTHALESAIFYLLFQKYNINIENFSIFFTILKHHGNLENVNAFTDAVLSDEDKLKNKYLDLNETISTVSRILNISFDWDIEDFCDLFDEEYFVTTYKLQGLKSYFQIKNVFSKLIFSDKYEAIFKEPYRQMPAVNAEKYINALNILIENKQNKLSVIRNQARKEILINFSKNSDKSIFILEGPTGIGKTFIALHLALEILKKKNKKRIINALPMTSIIDQTYEEYSKIIDSSELLKFHHLTHSKNYIDSIEESEEEKNQTRQRNEYLTTSWSSDKIIITTFNQLLNCFYSNTNKDLIKFWTLRDSVIILDEIQAIPRVLLQDFSQTINFLAKEYRIDFVLMSATIPAIKKFLNTTITCELLDNKYFSMDFNNRYSLQLNLKINDCDLLIDAVQEAADQNNSVLCVVNTKKLAYQIYAKLEESFDEELFLLSANFIPKHRKQCIAKIKNRLGEKQKTILISTQVVEVGVDFDFETGFREFAPFASIIQTAGRINREGKRNLANLVITDKIGSCPYHFTDILKEEVTELLKEEVQEKNMLNILKQYFQIVINKTSPDLLLLNKMQNLDFEDVATVFNETYMPYQPDLNSIFIEIEEDLLMHFKERRRRIFEKYKKDETQDLLSKQSLKIELKNLHKKIAQYIINVPFRDIKHLPLIWEDSDIFYLPNNYVQKGSLYSIEAGWNSTNDDNMW